MRPRYIPFLASFMLLSACAAELPPGQTIWSPAEKRYLAESEAMARMADAPFLLLGESHDNPLHHRLQAKIVQTLAAGGQHRALAFEMIERDRQQAVESHLQKHPKDASGLGAALDWEKRGWPDFSMYAPVFQAGLDGGWPVVGANLPRSQARQAGSPEGLGREAETRLGLDKPLGEAVMSELKRNLIEAHCGLLPESAIAPMTRLQMAWDGQMAASLVESATRNGAVLIAGAEHVRTDRAVPWRLAHLSPGKAALAVAFKEQTDPPTSPEYETWPYDLVWFTPHRDQPDHCLELKERLQKK